MLLLLLCCCCRCCCGAMLALPINRWQWSPAMRHRKLEPWPAGALTSLQGCPCAPGATSCRGTRQRKRHRSRLVSMISLTRFFVAFFLQAARVTLAFRAFARALSKRENSKRNSTAKEDTVTNNRCGALTHLESLNVFPVKTR